MLESIRNIRGKVDSKKEALGNHFNRLLGLPTLRERETQILKYLDHISRYFEELNINVEDFERAQPQINALINACFNYDTNPNLQGYYKPKTLTTFSETCATILTHYLQNSASLKENWYKIPRAQLVSTAENSLWIFDSFLSERLYQYYHAQPASVITLTGQFRHIMGVYRATTRRDQTPRSLE